METLVKPKTADEAMDIARRAAARLRELGATRVVLFGSLPRGTYVPGESDIDLYFEGIGKRTSDLAMLAILDEFGEETVDPIPADSCPEYIKDRVETQGIPL
jgi:predicted nucleotidyltransferase